MQNTNLGNFMNELFFKALVPQQLLTLALAKQNAEEFLTSAFKYKNFEELVQQHLASNDTSSNVIDHKAVSLANQLKLVSKEVSALEDLAIQLYKQLTEYFQDNIDNRKVVLKDTCESLQYFYSSGSLEQGIEHQIKNFTGKKNTQSQEVKSIKTLSYDELEQLAHITAPEKRQLAERGEMSFILESVEFEENLDELVTTFCQMYYNYLDKYFEYKKQKDEQQKPLEFEFSLQESASNRQQKQLMEQIIAGLSPVKEGQSIQEIYDFVPLYYLFVGNQSTKMLEFPTTLSMHIFNKIKSALTAISRMKISGQKQHPKTIRDISAVLPEILEDEEQITNINQQWFDWKFDLYSIQQGIIKLLEKRALGELVSTSCNQLNLITNNIGVQQANAALNLIKQSSCVA